MAEQPVESATEAPVSDAQDPVAPGTETLSNEQLEAMLGKFERGEVPHEPTETDEPQAEESEAEETTEAESDESEQGGEDAERMPSGPAVAENKRLREKNRELANEAATLREEMARINGRLDELSKPKSAEAATSVEAQISAANEADLLSAKQNLELKMFEANQDGDREGYTKSVNMKALIEQELRSRQKAEASAAPAKASAEQQFTDIRSKIVDRFPALREEGSDMRKHVETFMRDNDALMQQLGPLGEVMAIAAVVGLNDAAPRGKSPGAMAAKIETGINQVVQNAVSRKQGSTTPAKRSGVKVPSTREGVDAVVSQLERGELSFDDLE